MVDAEGTDWNGIVTRVASWHECSICSTSRAVRVAFNGFRSECKVREICNGVLTTVVTSLAPSEEDVELFITLPAGGFRSIRACGIRWRATEEREASKGGHGGMWLRIMG